MMSERSKSLDELNTERIAKLEQQVKDLQGGTTVENFNHTMGKVKTRVTNTESDIAILKRDYKALLDKIANIKRATGLTGIARAVPKKEVTLPKPEVKPSGGSRVPKLPDKI